MAPTAPTHIFLLEGNVGAGKTTLLKELERTVPGLVAVFEPVDAWLDMKDRATDKSLFELYYEDKVKYGFLFQMAALLSRMRHLKSVLDGCTPGSVVVCERSYISDHQIFAAMMRDQGQLTPMEYKVYEMWHAFLVEVLQPHVAGVVYLRTPPDVCAQRVQKCHRAGEVGHIDVQFLHDLHDQHERCLAALPLPKYLLPDGDQVARRQLDSWLLDAAASSMTVSACA